MLEFPQCLCHYPTVKLLGEINICLFPGRSKTRVPLGREDQRSPRVQHQYQGAVLVHGSQ